MKKEMKKNRLREPLFQLKKIGLLLFFATLYITANSQAGKLYIGTATADITPALPVAVNGQFNLQIAYTAETPLTANVVALESRDGSRSLDASIMVSCDLAGIPGALLKMVRDEVQKQVSELDVRKIFLNATHTHTAPVVDNDPNSSWFYQVPKKGVLQVEDYNAFFVQCVTKAIVKAWKNRRPGSVTWGLSHAAVADNRMAVYSKEFSTPGHFADGTARMYGNTNSPEFLNLQGMADNDVNSLFFWNQEGKLIAINILVACPAQEVEHNTGINADFWHPVRVALRQRFGDDLCVLGWISAAGDQSPHLMYRKAAEDRMRELRRLSRLEEISRRIVNAVDEAYEAVKDDRHAYVPMIHKVETMSLPMRLVTEAEYERSRAERDTCAAQIAADPKAADQVFTRMIYNRDVVNRFEKQRIDPRTTFDMELHVLRIGDVAICTNEFELFTEYGIRIQARSKALQTFVIELVGLNNFYLPTEKAVKGGGYSANIQSGAVGPEGGQVIVERSLQLINDMFPAAK
jgi:hypothetical protein